MRQNPCRYCALSWNHNGRHSPSHDQKCYDCENIKKHQEYLKSQRKFELGEPIKDFDELMKQEWVFVGYANLARHIEAVKSWQLRSVLSVLEKGHFYKAIRKKESGIYGNSNETQTEESPELPTES